MRRALAVAICLSVSSVAAEIPRRIVSLSPDLTEMLFGVGALPRVVAVSNFDTYPPEVAKLPHIGTLSSPSLERLTALRPDLIVIDSAQAPFIEDTLKQLGFPLLEVWNRTISEACKAMLEIGRATGNETAAVKLAAETRDGLDRVARKTASAPKPRVVLIIDRLPGTLRDLYTATDGSYLAELVAIAGGRIAVPKAETGYKKLSQEDLLAIDPDVILDFVHGQTGGAAANSLQAWQDMPELRAVREHHVYSINQDYVPHASQRMVQTAELFAKLLHPEIQ